VKKNALLLYIIKERQVSLCNGYVISNIHGLIEKLSLTLMWLVDTVFLVNYCSFLNDNKCFMKIFILLLLRKQKMK